jgi:hypothetical protein
MSPTTSLRAVALAGIAGTSALALLALAPGASASHGNNGIRKSGPCSSSAHWTVKVKAEHGALESEFEVDTNRVGQVWSYRITDNGVLLRSGNARTTAPSGSFEVRKLSRNRPGVDHFVARAHNARTGQTCAGALNF